MLHIDPFAFRVVGADGAVLHDADGHDYVDLLGDYSAGLLGRRAAVAGVIRDVLDRGWSYGAMSEPETLFAEAVVARFPSIDQVRFTNSGTEANVMALMTARHATGRGRGSSCSSTATTAARCTSGTAASRCGSRSTTPCCRTTTSPPSRPSSPPTATTSPASSSSRCSAPAVASRATRRSWPTLRRLTADAGAVLIFDEVMTSRLAVGGAQELLGITPDMTTLGKYLAGGLSFGAFGGRADLMAAFDPARGGG